MERSIAFAICFVMCLGILIFPAETVEASGGTYRALLVACTDSRLGQGPYNDLMMMRLALINMGVPAQNIRVISNNTGNNYNQHNPNQIYPQLKKENVKSWIRQAYSGANSNDTNIFFFSGHGNSNGIGTSYNGTNLVLNDYYPTDELASDLAAVPGKHLVMLDCCNSGGIISKSAVYDASLQDDMLEEFEGELATKSAAHRANFYVITAASAREESLGSMLGMLTTSLTNAMGVTYRRSDSDNVNTPYYSYNANVNNSAMADQNRDRKITLNELFDHVYREATGSVPTVYPQDSDAVLFTYSSVQPAHVTNMTISGPNANGQVSGTFEYYGPGTPSAYIAGHSIIQRGNGMFNYTASRTASLSNIGGNKYSYSLGGLDLLFDKVIKPEPNDTALNYGFKVDIRNSSSTSPIYRKPFNITNSGNASSPTVVFKETSPQPERILSGGQEYRLQLAYNYDGYVDVFIMDRHGNKVRTLANNTPTKMKFPNSSNPAREMDFYWDGRDDNGNFIPGDGYIARAVGRNNVGTSPVVVDSRLASVKVGGAPSSISIAQGYRVGTGASTIIKVISNPSGAYTGSNWTSSNTAIATVDNGRVTGVSVGQVTITATSKENPSLSAQTLVTVFRAGWQRDSNGFYYYVKPDGQRADNWYKVGNTWYYFKNTLMQTGWVKDSNRWYYMMTDGRMATNWIKVGSNWFYMKPSGAMATSWQKLGGTWYYLKSSGVMATGWHKDKGKWYYMKPSGAMATGWEKINGKWYYLDTSGAMVTNWKYIGGKWYYFYSSGIMAANTTIDGKYRLGASGAML